MGADVQMLVGKIMSDEQFAEALVANPKSTLEEAGIEPTVDLLEALDGVDVNALKELAASFGENQAAV
ncbi:MAG: hypothetical protein D6768_16185 [Chloroflexi bacterium]|nr:MAG: hypothetical protein D6768_16185 [Chloroflexota bacterium]